MKTTAKTLRHIVFRGYRASSAKGTTSRGRGRPACRIAGVVAALLAAAPGPAQEPSASDPKFAHFEAKVRPLLVTRCGECHAESEEGDLRVDSREALLRGGESGPALDLAAPAKSLLIRSVRHEAGAPEMPRKRTKLTDAEVADLLRWIEDGAPWPAAAPAPVAAIDVRIAESRDFWSFRPLTAPTPPTTRDAAWPRTPIDAFVLAALEERGLAPVPAADPAAWLRRVTFGVTGLPPTPEETDAFLADASAEGRKKVVERLLASPAYGEHWARLWLDVARYAEDDCRSLDPAGRGFADYPEAFRYRDWVIQAFNEDLPFADFVRAQLAADLLPDDARVRHLPALGFLGLGPWLYDNGSLEVTRADERHDRVDVVGRGLLGLTVACARCHDHKTDPVSSRDYYALAGVFLNTRYKEHSLVPGAAVAAYEVAEERLFREQKLLNEILQSEAKFHAALLTRQAARYLIATWRVLGPERRDPEQVADADKLDTALLARWLTFVQKPPVHYPYLREWQALLAKKGDEDEARKLAEAFQGKLVDVLLAMREADEQNEIIRAKALPGTKKRRPTKRPNEFLTNDDFCPGCGLELVSLPKDDVALWTDVYQRDLDATTVDDKGNSEPRPGLLVLRGDALMRELGSERRRAIEDLTKSIAKARKDLGLKYAHVHGVEDVETPTDLRIHLRGDPFKLGEAVPRRFPAVLQPAEAVDRGFTRGSGREELAERIVAHPLAIRVFVNRIWKRHFGAGIVDTPGNFGPHGDPPSHPELLEHLASRFVAGGGSLKALHREILLSATYGLAAVDEEKARAVDGAHRLRWRFDERRLSAEELRDAMLAASGVLDAHLYGPSTKLTPTGKRRTIYAEVSRYSLDPYLALFDFPSPAQSSERRFATNVPTQRLYLMNSDFVQEQAEQLAVRLSAKGDDRARIVEAYRILFQRPPKEDELLAGLEFLRDEPMRSYEDAKAERARAEAEAKGGEGAASSPTAKVIEAFVAKPKKGAKKSDAGDGEGPGDAKGGPGDGASSEGPPLPVTPLGRYVKVLLCSNEFLFLR